MDRSQWEDAEPWRKVSVEQDTLFERIAHGSCDGDGRMRQEAVRRLSMRSHGLELPFLLLRLNDWVRVVREEARAALEDRLHPGYARHWLKCLPLAERVTEGRRGDHGWLMDRLEALSRDEDCREELVEGVKSDELSVRAWCLKVAMSCDGEVARQVFEGAMSDRDPQIRFQALRRRLAGATPDEVQEWHGRWGNDPFMPIRRHLLDSLVRVDAGAADGPLQEALFDRHVSMREMARFYLREKIDAATVYREAMDRENGGRLRIAILGLGETGGAADAERLAAFLKHALPCLREAAVRAVGRLAADPHAAALMDAVGDSSHRVGREAVKGLGPVARAVEAAIVARLPGLMADQRPTVRKNVLFLVCRLSHWEQIGHLLRAVADDSPMVSATAAGLLLRWLSRNAAGHRTPSGRQREEVLLVFENAKSRLPQCTRQWLVGALGWLRCSRPVACREAARCVGW